MTAPARYSLVFLLAPALLGPLSFERVCFSADAKPAFRSPVSAKQSLEHLKLAPGLKIELAAAEPLVVDPVAIRFDEQGRMWVVEMRDYPVAPPKGQPPQSRIRVLEDRDRDGYYESARTFADGLVFPTGLQPWKGGVFVTLAGKLVYMKDTNGDGRADQREVWFTGFAEQNEQLRANHPRLARDGYIYVANGLRGGTVVDARRKGAKAVSISGRDFRFHPITGHYEAVSGNGQFGLTLDDWGRRFVCSNRRPLTHVVLEGRYVRRNPLLALPAVEHDVATSGAESRIFPVSRAWTTSTLHAGQFTAACGVHIFRGDGLGGSFYGNGFTCDPTGNLVHRELLTSRGATFSGRPARQGVEFLASPDTWFRPVNLQTGPDGALYVVDMYRAVIEHPQWVPAELKTRTDTRYGDDRGRIYRITASSAKPAAQGRAARLARRTSAELVDLLDTKKMWQRETAARLLLERQDASVRGALETIVRKSKRPVARGRALWCLMTLSPGGKTLRDELLLAALDDPHARVREQAVRLAESRLEHSTTLREKVIALASDDDARVRFQVALTIGGLKDHEALRALAQIAAAGAQDPWTRRAVATGASRRAQKLFSLVLRSQGATNAGGSADFRLLVRELAALAGRDPRDGPLRAILIDVATLSGQGADAVQRAALVGLARGLARRGSSLNQQIQHFSASNATLGKQLVQLIVEAATIAADGKKPLPQRRQCVELLRHADAALAVPVLVKLAQRELVQTLRLAAIDALARHRHVSIAPALLAEFRSQTPAVRRAILDAMIAHEERALKLLDAIDSARIKTTEIDPVRTRALVNHKGIKVKQRAKALFAAAVPVDRAKVLKAYQSSLAMQADAQRGRAVFAKNCATCHKIGDLGVNVAPDIADSRTKTPAQLLTDILQPNRAIDANYVGYSVVTTDGKIHEGIIKAETAQSITLGLPEGKTLTLLRSDIEQLRSSGVSLMPEGLEKNVNPQQMADLISFIKNWRYLDGQVPLRGK
ncbi:MAG: HEAT repeat domain-containing protein [Planctomycetes bacterium]|nr:HEAT repeat domain-containing protein [Planctomycetota bacterium]